MFIISFQDALYAQTFVDYMKTKGVTLYIQFDANDISQVFLANEEIHNLELVRAELINYTNNPSDKRYIDATWYRKDNDSIKESKRLKRIVLPEIKRAGFVTSIVTLICIGLFLFSLLTNSGILLNYLGYPFYFRFDQLWRYITPIFIHFSFLHIVFNLTWWWYLGGIIEKRLGWTKLIEITLISGLLSNFAEAMISGPYFGGLSGVVYALMGYVWLYGEKNKFSGIGLDRTMLGIAVIWLIAGYTGLLGSIANTAHLTGLIVGLLLAGKDIWLIKKP